MAEAEVDDKELFADLERESKEFNKVRNPLLHHYYKLIANPGRRN